MVDYFSYWVRVTVLVSTSNYFNIILPISTIPNLYLLGTLYLFFEAFPLIISAHGFSLQQTGLRFLACWSEW